MKYGTKEYVEQVSTQAEVNCFCPYCTAMPGHPCREFKNGKPGHPMPRPHWERCRLLDSYWKMGWNDALDAIYAKDEPVKQ